MVFKRGRFYHFKFMVDGKPVQLSTHQENKDVAKKMEAAERTRLALVDAGLEAPASPVTKRQHVTVNELVDALQADYELRGIMSPQNNSRLKRLREEFGQKRARDLTSEDIDVYIQRRLADGCAPASVNRTTQLLGQALRLALERGHLSKTPHVRRLDEKNNVRKGKFTEREAQQIFSSLPPYMADVARFAYETGSRVGEILKLLWSYLSGDGIEIPAEITKNRKARSLALTPELDDILLRRRAARVGGCDLIFHHDGRPIRDYRKCWQSACLINGLGKLYCRNCRCENGEYIAVLDAKRKCPVCGQKCVRPKYIGAILHDLRRTAAHEMWKAGSTIEECMEVTGHKTPAMFLRYADLFSDEERRNKQREVQRRRREWRQAQREHGQNEVVTELVTVPPENQKPF